LKISSFLAGRKVCSACIAALCCLLFSTPSVLACGGLFYAQSPVKQQTERIIYTHTPTSTTIYEQISYQGKASDFAWILPVPVKPVVETAPLDLFTSLEGATAPRFIPPEPPACGLQSINLGDGRTSVGAPGGGGGNVKVYQGGTVGPYQFEVIGSKDPQALTQWLESHQYQVPANMTTVIAPYVQMNMLFLAMRLKPEASVQAIAPVKITLPTPMTEIMLPLGMASVAAEKNLGILIWIFGEQQFAPKNYQSFSIQEKQLTAIPYAGANYEQVVTNSIKQAGGRAFVTEYARPSEQLYVGEPTIRLLLQQHPYVTRLYTRISPELMTIDPVFVPRSGLPEVRGIYNLSQHPAPTDCSSFDLWLGSLGGLAYPLIGAVSLGGIGLLFGGGLWLTRRNQVRREHTK
jgi:hypothetical protein